MASFQNFQILNTFSGYKFIEELSASEIATNGYSKNPFVSMVVERIAKVSSFLKLENDVKFIDIDTKKQIFTNLLLFGEVFIYPVKPVGMSKIASFEILTNADVQIEYEETSVFKPIKNYRYITKTFLPSEIIHIKYSNITSQYKKGRSPLNPAQTIYSASNSINDFEYYLYKNRGVMGLISGVGEMPLVSVEQEKLQEQFELETTGVQNGGKLKLIQNEVKYTPLNFKPSEMVSSESNLDKLRIICSIYDVDSSLFNDPANQTYNNVAEATKAFYNSAVLPLCDYVWQKINEYLIGEKVIKESEPIVIDYSDIDALKKDETLSANAKKTHQEAYKIFLDNIKFEMEMQLITQVEARKKIKEYCEKNNM